MEASQNGLPWECLGEVASQLAACAGECESFLAEQLAASEQLERRLAQRTGDALQRHPHADDPVIAAVLAEFAALKG